MNTLSLVEKLACLSGEDKEWLERLIDRVLVSPTPKKSCDCHVIDPEKVDIIIWSSNNPQHPNDLIVQFARQKFIGMPRIDKRGERYWKVRKFYEDEEGGSTATPSVNSSLTKKELELLESYQAKVQANTPMKDFSKAEVDAYCKWNDEQEKLKKQQEQIKAQSQQRLENEPKPN